MYGRKQGEGENERRRKWRTSKVWKQEGVTKHKSKKKKETGTRIKGGRGERDRRKGQRKQKKECRKEGDKKSEEGWREEEWKDIKTKRRKEKWLIQQNNTKKIERRKEEKIQRARDGIWTKGRHPSIIIKQNKTFSNCNYLDNRRRIQVWTLKFLAIPSSPPKFIQTWNKWSYFVSFKSCRV